MELLLFIHIPIEFTNVCVDIDKRAMYLTHTCISLQNFPLCFVHATYIAYVSLENREGKFATQYNLLKRPRRNLVWSTLDFHRFLQKPDRDCGDGRDEEGLRQLNGVILTASECLIVRLFVNLKNVSFGPDFTDPTKRQ